MQQDEQHRQQTRPSQTDQSAASEAGQPTRTVSMPVGIPGVNLRQEQRTIPVSEPDPWPTNDQLRVVGKRERRKDAHLKVTGEARYTADVRLPGMLYARMLRSPHPHARIRSIDTRAASAYPGVRAIHVVDTVLGSATERDPGHQNPKEMTTGGKPPEIRYVGQAIAAVAATSQHAADEAARLIRVDFEVLPFVADMEDARKSGAPLVFSGPTEQEGTGGGGGAPKGLPQNGNVRGPERKSRGDTGTGFAQAEVTVQGEFRTQVQTHSQLETNGIVADWRPEGLTVYISTQGTSGVQGDLAEFFHLPKPTVRVVTEFMGGGFGAKFGPGTYGVAAVQLSRKTGAPVRLMLDRREQHLTTGNRPSTRQQVRMGAKKDGTLTAIQLTSYGTAGVGLGAGVGNVAEQMYRCPHFLGEQYDVFIHAGPGAAFRAPGAPQGAFAIEQLIDMLAEQIGMDPVVLRDRNDESVMRREQRHTGAERFGWQKRRAPGSDAGPVKHGFGMAQSHWGRYVEVGGGCEVAISRDGHVEVRSSVQDLGTGIRTVLAQVVAEELGLEARDVIVRIGDTVFTAGPGSGGSKTTGSITPVARNGAYQVGRQLKAQAAKGLNVRPEELEFAKGRLVVRGNPAQGVSFQEAASQLTTEISATAKRGADYGGFQATFENNGVSFGHCAGVQFAEVSVDTETGYVRAERVVAVHDCGRPMNPVQIESQINGGVIQGVSWALYENRHLDAKNGWMVNADLQHYKILGAREVPQIDVVLLEEYTGRSSTDAHGVAEPANIATAAAIANAVYNAIGVRIYELPITPDRVLAALRARPSGRRQA